ncbi:hypothetical protein MNBD_GAMMA03-1221 [hydrothermal vent metagenome]|uniref:Uncharacterized protein n=1 Tax=hydrothermal vent metagenome TaxID=652676 RepID=A0A3B0WTN4_9ZZZZ
MMVFWVRFLTLLFDLAKKRISSNFYSWRLGGLKITGA